MAKRDRRQAGDTPLFGRDRELDHLKDALHQAVGGKGRIELVTGEPGIGKTRLLEELSSYAESCGIRVFSACCLDDPGSPPYWPWSQIIASLVVGMKPGLLLGALGPNAELAAEAFPSIQAAVRHPLRTAPDSNTAESARFRLFDAVVRLFAARSREQPLVLALDDLHWADEPSLKLLVHLCAGLSRSPILLLGAYRNLAFEPGHPLPAAIGSLTQHRWCSRVPLHGLSETDAAGLLASGVGKASGQSLAQTVYHLTDGNPLFITEIVRLLAEDPDASTAPGGLAVGVRDVIARRLSRLSPACNETVTVAAVLGSEFAATVLEDTIDPSLAVDTASAIDEAVKERIIEETGDLSDRYRFLHVLIRDAILSCLQPSRRAALHARVFNVLEDRWKDGACAHASKMLAHAVQGQSVLGPEPAARYALYAGEVALRAHAFEDARRHFATGLSALQDRPMDDLKAALVFGSAKAGCVLDMGHESKLFFQRCFEYYEAHDNTEKMVEVLTYRYVLPEPDLLPLYERTLGRVAHDSLERGRLLASYGVIKAIGTREGRKGAPELLEALRLARLYSDQWLEMRVLWLASLADQLRFESKSAERLSLLRQADELARRLDDCSDEIWIRSLMLWELLCRGRVEEAADLAGKMRETADRQGDLTDRLRARSADLDVARHRAEWGRVRELCSRQLEEAPPLYLSDGHYLAFRCEAAYEAGDFTASREDLLRLVDTTRAVPRVPAWIFLVCGEAITRASRATGDTSLLGEAHGFARLILEISDTNEAQERDAHFILGRVCVLRGDSTGAVAEYDYFAELLRRTPAEDRPFSMAHGALGALAAVIGNLDSAVAHYERAVRVEGYTVHDRAWLLHDFARVLSLRRTPGDGERARDLLQDCLETSESVTLVPLAERVREALVRLGDGGREVRLDGLTDREAGVLALIARGLTNKEIGAKLFISAKTVDAHVRNILSKTGTSNRAEAVAYAIWHKLPGV